MVVVLFRKGSDKQLKVGDILNRKIIPLKEQVRIACNLAGISMTELGKRMKNPLSQQSMSKRLATGKFTKDELYEIADILGCELHFYFEFNNGNKIY